MLVIGPRELRFQSKCRTNDSGAAQENYGPIHDLSAIPPARAGRAAGKPKAIFEFCGMKFESPRGPCRRHG